MKEAVLEQKIDDLVLRFDQAEERNREEHREIRGGIRQVHSDIQHLSRTVALGFASLAASVIGAVGAAIVANAV